MKFLNNRRIWLLSLALVGATSPNRAVAQMPHPWNVPAAGPVFVGGMGTMLVTVPVSDR